MKILNTIKVTEKNGLFTAYIADFDITVTAKSEDEICDKVLFAIAENYEGVT